MKKRILLVLLVAVLALTLTAGLVACKKKTAEKKDDPAPSVDPDPKAPAELTSKDLEFVLGETFGGVKTIISDLAEVSTAYYADLTIFADVNDINADIRVAATIDGNNLGNNKALVNVAVSEEDVATLYVQDSTLYVGQSLLQDDFAWLKFSEVADNNLASKIASGVPSMVSEGVGTIKKDVTSTLTMVESFLPMVGGLGVFKLEVPKGYSLDADTLADGTYVVNIEMSELSGLLDMLKSVIDIKSTLKNLDEPVATIVTKAVEIVFGGTLDDLLDGKIENYPAIALSFDFKDGGLNGFAVSYDKEADAAKETDAISVAFGIKDLTIKAGSKAAQADIAPSVTLSKVQEASLKASVTVEAPAFKVNGTDALDLALDAYVMPGIDLNLDVNGVEISNFSATLGDDAKAIVVAKNAGELVGAADYDLKSQNFRIDLAPLFGFFSTQAANNGQYKGYFNLDKLIAGDDDWYYTAKNEAKAPSTNPIDQIYSIVLDVIADFSEGSFDIGGLVGKATDVIDNVKAIATEIADADIFEVNALDGVASISINFANLLAYAAEEESVIGTCELINKYIDISEYADVETLIDFIAGALGKDSAVIYNYIEIVTGKDATEAADYIGNCKLILSALASDGYGIGVEIKDATGETVVKVTATIDIIGANEIPATEITANFNGTDLYGQDGPNAALEAFGKDMLALIPVMFPAK